jgi:hypothetical protein
MIAALQDDCVNVIHKQNPERRSAGAADELQKTLE